MTLLYRSPNVAVDGHEWHVTVEQANGGRPVVRHKFRPKGTRAWRSIHQYPTRPPPCLVVLLRPFRFSINLALTGAGAERRFEKSNNVFPQWKRALGMAPPGRRKAA